MYKDLREFIGLVDNLGALRRIEGADPRFEIGGITEVAAGMPDCPALLFDDIKGFPRGFRIFSNAVTNPQRAALALGLDPALRPLDALKAWMEKRKTLQAARAGDGEGRAVPGERRNRRRRRSRAVPGAGLAPPRRRPLHRLGLDRHHARSRTTAGSTPRSTASRCTAGTRSRCSSTTAAGTAPSSRRSTGTRARPCPVAVVNGEDPALFIAGFEYLPAGQSEYAFAGAIKGAPIEIIAGAADRPAGPGAGRDHLRGPPAADERGDAARRTVRRVHRLLRRRRAAGAGHGGRPPSYHRDDPILLGSPPMKPPRFHFGLPFRAATHLAESRGGRRHRRGRRLAARLAAHDRGGAQAAL